MTIKSLGECIINAPVWTNNYDIKNYFFFLVAFAFLKMCNKTWPVMSYWQDSTWEHCCLDRDMRDAVRCWIERVCVGVKQWEGRRGTACAGEKIWNPTHPFCRTPASCCQWQRWGGVGLGRVSACDLIGPCLVRASSCSWSCGWCGWDYHSCLSGWTQYLRIEEEIQFISLSRGRLVCVNVCVGWENVRARKTDCVSFSPPGKNQSACWMIGSMIPTICRDTVVIISVMFLNTTNCHFNLKKWLIYTFHL